ncbi:MULTISPECIES: gamma carbonic anhydrase family protein [Paenibacillus]|uniref:Carbonic anhydrase or acetyltransferase, isoleucine patch superfamily n=3 Tax=Paenibacillus TaxID=44249 RepID=A0A1H8FSF6_9BACL|nr:MULTISPECIES: gamma carbonic anhydrase family protein [Paenibacillus]AHV97636.1 hexapeptide repeat-containing transferase [Paenibacillus sabinae T27]QWU13961.1 gamma carbonic anhydrase family protein [Paenibacillus sophorae]RQW13351.1 gamma carbonic anhydrase family protein [Paenibacillus rhizophilus]SEN34490.1 Carbonic anhydrase or acetyltransferase, isoleucine patch superfamily [Paenibacillus sophorae]
MNIYEFNGIYPKIADGVFIAPTATIIGDVVIEEGSSIWFGAVLRGDAGSIRIGKNNSIQDNCVVHMTDSGTFIGDNNTIGHGSILHNCTIGNNNVIGMNAVVLDGAVIQNENVIAAGSVITGNTRIEDRQLFTGSPGQFKKELSGSSLWWVQESSNVYLKLVEQYDSRYKYHSSLK